VVKTQTAIFAPIRRFFIGHGGESTEARRRERNRRAILTSASNLVAQGVGLVTSLVSVPLTIRYLGKERYGLWGTISALLMWAALADFGLGRGLINHLSEAFAKDDRDSASRYVSTALFTLCAVAGTLAILFMPLILVLPWHELLNVKSEYLRLETRATVAAVVAVFLTNFPLSVVGPIYAAYQRTYVANVFRIVGNILSLGILIVATQLKVSLPWLVLATGGVPLVMSLVNLAYISRDMPWLRPSLTHFGRRALGELMVVSTPLLLFQVGSLLINELQTIIVARRSGLIVVADYTVFLKVYSVPVLILTMIDGPLLPAYREALARRDVIWLRATFWRVQGIKVLVCAAAALFFVVFGNAAIGVLSGHRIRFGTEVWIAASVLTIVGTWNGSFNDLLVSTNRLWTLVWFILANGVVTASLTYVAAQRLGVFGIIAATTTYSLLLTAWLFPVLCWKHISPRATVADLNTAANRVTPLIGTESQDLVQGQDLTCK
jgi:O-antigen/teichoic acid export membrane protein